MKFPVDPTGLDAYSKYITLLRATKHNYNASARQRKTVLKERKTMFMFNIKKALYPSTAALLSFALLNSSCSGPTPADEIVPDETVHTQTSTPSEMDALRAIKQAADEVKGVQDPATMKAAIAEAKDLNYLPASGLVQDFEKASVSTVSDGSILVSVPLSGTNTPEVTKVSYIQSNGSWNVMELSVHQTSEDRASLKMWMDGSLVRDQLITPPAEDSAYGMNWGRLKHCLVNDANVNWIVLGTLSTICSAACLFTAGFGCVACVAAVVGFNSGTIAACVRRAWR